MKKTFSKARVKMGWEKTASSSDACVGRMGSRSATIVPRCSVCCNKICRYEPSAYIVKMYL